MFKIERRTDMEKKNNNNPNLRIKSDGIQIRVNGKWITPTIDD